MKKTALIFALLITFFYTSGELFAQRGRKMHMRQKHRDMCYGEPEYLKEKLRLTDEQINRIGKINKDYRIKFLKFREKISPKKIRLRRLLLKNNVNINEIRELLKETSAIEVEIRLLRIEQRLSIEKILTPEQRERLRNENRRILNYDK